MHHHATCTLRAHTTPINDPGPLYFTLFYLSSTERLGGLVFPHLPHSRGLNRRSKALPPTHVCGTAVLRNQTGAGRFEVPQTLHFFHDATASPASTSTAQHHGMAASGQHEGRRRPCGGNQRHNPRFSAFNPALPRRRVPAAPHHHPPPRPLLGRRLSPAAPRPAHAPPPRTTFPGVPRARLPSQ